MQYMRRILGFYEPWFAQQDLVKSEQCIHTHTHTHTQSYLGMKKNPYRNPILQKKEKS